MKKDGIKNCLEIVSIVVPAVITILSTILDNILKVEIWNILSIVFTVLTLIFAVVVVIINIHKECQHKKIISELRQVVDICCDGKKYLSNDATVEFIKESFSYKITICKKFELLSMDANYYPVRISCDKYPEDLVKSTAFYKEQKDIWKDLNFQVSMVVGNNEKVVRYDNIYFETVLEQNNHIYFKVFYKQLVDNQTIDIPIKQGDVVSIVYSLIVSSLYWGSYINRPVDINKADTSVSFVGNLPEDLFTVITIDLNGTARQVLGYDFKNDGEKTVFILPTKQLSVNEIKNCHFRIYWDANKIFNTDNLNSKFVGPIDPIWKLFD